MYLMYMYVSYKVYVYILCICRRPFHVEYVTSQSWGFLHDSVGLYLQLLSNTSCPPMMPRLSREAVSPRQGDVSVLAGPQSSTYDLAYSNAPDLSGINNRTPQMPFEWRQTGFSAQCRGSEDLHFEPSPSPSPSLPSPLARCAFEPFHHFPCLSPLYFPADRSQ